MNVRQLIEALQKVDPELQVVKLDRACYCGCNCNQGRAIYEEVEAPDIRLHANVDGNICIDDKFPKFVDALVL